MARMPTEHDLGPVEGFAHRELHAAEDTLRHLMHPHHHDAPQPAAQPPIPHNVTQEVPPMSLATAFAAVESHFQAGLSEVQNVDRDAINDFDAIKANPEAAAILSVLASVAKAELPAGMLSAATSGLQVLQHFAAAPAAVLLTPDAVPAPQPAGPVVAGQA